MDTRNYRNGSMIVGVLLIVLGVVFFAVTQGAFGISWENMWPLFPALFGLVVLALAFTAHSPTSRALLVAGGTIPFLIGLFFFATTTGVLSWEDQGILWPVYPLIVGVACIAAYFASDREQPWYLWPGGICALVGAAFLTITLTGTPYSYFDKIWPLFLILAGVLLMVVPRARHIGT